MSIIKLNVQKPGLNKCHTRHSLFNIFKPMSFSFFYFLAILSGMHDHGVKHCFVLVWVFLVSFVDISQGNIL